MSTQPKNRTDMNARSNVVVSIVALLSLSACCFAAEPATQPTGNGGRDPSIPPDTNSPVLRQIPAARSIKKLKEAPLYSFNERDVDAYLGYLHDAEPDPIKRVVHLARKNIGQPYAIYLLGEYPYELYDPDPMYCLEKSDCVTFVENTYAMALSHDWPGYFKTLQRLRYKDGKVGMLTRNHESVADWDPNNGWLFEEITAKLAGGSKTKPMHLVWQPSAFFARWGIGQDLKDVTVD